MPPGLPLASPTVPRDATNAGRVQSIAVSPTDANRSIIAMQFGGLWRTFNNGATIEAREKNAVLTTADFVKGFSEEGKAARDKATR